MTAYQHTNRRGETYYLQAGKTKTGKPRYYMGRKISGTPLASVPDGYQIWESPESAQVYVRKERVSPITDAERAFLEETIRQAGVKHFIVDVDGHDLLVYLLDRDPEAVSGLMDLFIGESASEKLATYDWVVGHANYQKMLRFRLVDEDERLYSVDRWCFRGSIDDWFPLAGPRPLPEQAEKYVVHLGKDSFFELF